MDRNLAAFLVVAEHGNMTVAAEMLSLAQPSLTRRLKLLEDEYSAELFVRMPRGMALTAAGKTLLEHAKMIEQRHLQAIEAMEAEKSGHISVIRIGAGPLFRRAYLAAAYEQFHEEFPRTRLELRADVHLRNIPMLKKGDLDIVFGAVVAEPNDDDIETLPITSVHLGALARQDHSLQRKRKLNASDLSDIQWVLYSDDPETTTMVRGFFIRNGLRPPEFTVQTTSYEFGLHLVATGNYVMPAPVELDQSFEPLGLSALPLAQPIDAFPAGAYFRKSSLAFPAVSRMLELVKATAGET